MCIFTTVMMRKRLSILMILLANILILVHVVIPHHHYNKEFVAVVNMLNEDTRDLFNHEYEHEHHQNRDTDPAHHHDCNKEDCMMNETVAAAVLKIQTDDGSEWTAMPQMDKVDVQQIWLTAIALYETSFTLYNKEGHVRQRTYIASGHTDFLACSKGFRAPPTC